MKEHEKFSQLVIAEGTPEGVVSIARRREPPNFVICDAAMRVLHVGPGLERFAEAFAGLGHVINAVREAIRSGDSIIVAYDDETALRIMPLGAGLAGSVAIFVDVFSHRGSLFAAAKAFALTKRESQVLRLLISGKSNPQIAAMLFVADSTVANHVQSVMRKMRVSKRMEIMSKLFELEHDTLE